MYRKNVLEKYNTHFMLNNNLIKNVELEHDTINYETNSIIDYENDLIIDTLTLKELPEIKVLTIKALVELLFTYQIVDNVDYKEQETLVLYLEEVFKELGVTYIPDSIDSLVEDEDVEKVFKEFYKKFEEMSEMNNIIFLGWLNEKDFIYRKYML